MRRSKTDQEAEGAVLYLGKPTLKRVRRWLEASGLESGVQGQATHHGQGSG